MLSMDIAIYIYVSSFQLPSNSRHVRQGIQDIVIDPFVGSGTSLISSILNKRNFVGYEYNEEFKELMKSRFEKEIPNHLGLLSFIHK
jgi:hypothetical protein